MTKSEAFETMHDGQTAIIVQVYQGEDPDALNNTEIGSFRIEGSERRAGRQRHHHHLRLDVNGILHVSSREKRTGLEKHITIDNATARFARRRTGRRPRAPVRTLDRGEVAPTR